MKVHVSLKGVSGIYRIRNTVNNKCYIGRTSSFYNRCCQYVCDFRSQDKSRINDYLLRAMNKYGLKSFVFEIIEECPIEQTPKRELYWILRYRSVDKNIGYNLRLDVEGTMVASEYTKKKISDRLRNEWKNGIRRDHSKKLKSSWSRRDRFAQSKLMSKNLTRYVYLVDGVEMDFQMLKSKNLHGVLGNFSRYKTDSSIFKGVSIVRRPI